MNYHKIFFLSFNFFLFTNSSSIKNVFDREIGDSCIVRSSNEQGVCTLLEHCPSVYSNWKFIDESERPKICGFYNETKPIVCCSLKDAFISGILNQNYYEYNNTCKDDYGNYGKITKLYECPYAIHKLDKGDPLKQICPYDVCNDLICCPNIFCKKNPKCRKESSEKIINERLNYNQECRVFNTTYEGVYTNKNRCFFYDSHIVQNKPIPKSCDWSYCRDFVCCPKIFTHISFCINKTNNLKKIDEINKSCESGNGKCVYKRNCNSKNPYLTKCGDMCDEDVICCPNENIEEVPKHMRECENYRIHLTKLAYDVNTTIDGRLAEPNEFPHMVVLGYAKNNNNILWNCGGSLISNQYILTAAHCLIDSEYGPVKFAQIGLINITNDFSLIHNVIQRIPHPDYESSSTYYDIALLKIEQKINISFEIFPTCLPILPDIPKNLIAIGFGQTSVIGPQSNQLNKVQLESFTHHECNESFKFNFNRKFMGIDDEIQFCAGSKSSKMDTCRGDSGGPIQSDHPKYFSLSIIHGITSFGRSCGFVGSPSIYTAVYPFISWIESIVWAV